MTRRHRGPWLLMATLATVAVLAVAVAASRSLSGRDSRRLAPAAPARSPALPARPALPEGPLVPQGALAGLRWSGYHGVKLPSSPLAGPRDTAGGRAWGFADTPLGALVAAVNIAVRANPEWGPGVFGPTIRGQVTGPDAGALLAACQASYDQAAATAGITAGEPLGSASVTEEAFRVIAWSPSQATIDLVSAGPGSDGRTVRAVTRIQVTWDGADWKVIAPPGGDWSAAASLLGSAAGYTPFPGQG